MRVKIYAVKQAGDLFCSLSVWKRNCSRAFDLPAARQLTHILLRATMTERQKQMFLYKWLFECYIDDFREIFICCIYPHKHTNVLYFSKPILSYLGSPKAAVKILRVLCITCLKRINHEEDMSVQSYISALKLLSRFYLNLAYEFYFESCREGSIYFFTIQWAVYIL